MGVKGAHSLALFHHDNGSPASRPGRTRLQAGYGEAAPATIGRLHERAYAVSSDPVPGVCCCSGECRTEKNTGHGRENAVSRNWLSTDGSKSKKSEDKAGKPGASDLPTHIDERIVLDGARPAGPIHRIIAARIVAVCGTGLLRRTDRIRASPREAHSMQHREDMGGTSTWCRCFSKYARSPPL